MTVELLEPVLEGGIRTTHFFNGRLLTAGDFQALERAILERETRLGRAIGEGVVTGLEVSLDQAHSTITHPVVTVTSGLAINGRGEVLALPADATVALTREATVPALGDAAFHACPPPGPPPPPAGALTNLGFYVLTVLPASGFEGRAPMTQLVEEGVSGSCGSRFAVSGVRFRLVRVPLAAGGASTTLRQQVVQMAGELDGLIPQLAAPNPPLALQQEAFRKTSLVRNGLAHLCFGSDHWTEFPTDPLAFVGSGSAAQPARTFLDELHGDGVLTDDEVPLGLVSWTSRGVAYVDQWAVRREAGCASPALPAVSQFRQQLDSLTLGNEIGVQPASITCESCFVRLPSLGVLTPVAAYGRPGFNQSVFFQNRTVRGPDFIEGALLPTLVALARRVPPIDLASAEAMSLYIVRENRQPFDLGAATSLPPYVVFVNGQTPSIGTPRFDLNYWNYAHFG